MTGMGELDGADEQRHPEQQTTDSPEACDERALAAARTALATAESRSVEPQHIAECRPQSLRCAGERGPVEAGDRCQIVVYRGSSRWEVVVVPTPATGAPTTIEIWVDEAGLEAGRVQLNGSTWGIVDGVRIEGRGEYASHSHGGEAARIGGATFEVANRRERPVELRIVGARWLTANSCELPREERARPKVAGLALEGAPLGGVYSVTIPAGEERTVRIGHVVQRAYMASCDRFATAALFEVDGAPVEVIGEHRVVRRTPLRR